MCRWVFVVDVEGGEGAEMMAWCGGVSCGGGYQDG